MSAPLLSTPAALCRGAINRAAALTICFTVITMQRQMVSPFLMRTHEFLSGIKVFIMDWRSEKVANVWSETGNLICSRRLFTSKTVVYTFFVVSSMVLI